MGIGVKWLKKALECTICSPQIQKFYGGGPPFKKPYSSEFRVHPPSSLTLRTFQTFLPKPILTPELQFLLFFVLELFHTVKSEYYYSLANTCKSAIFMIGSSYIFPGKLSWHKAKLQIIKFYILIRIIDFNFYLFNVKAFVIQYFTFA